MGYYLYNTSLKLTMVFSTVFFCQVGIEYLCDKFSVYSNFDDFMKLKNKYSNKLNELFSNIRMIKSFVKEKEEIKKIENYKQKTSDDSDIYSETIYNFSKLVEKCGEAITLL